MSYQVGREAKITPNRFYLKNSVLIRVIRINKKMNAVYIHRYDTFADDVMEYDTAHFGLVPIFRIGDVAKMLNRKPDTLRKYEKQGLIPPQRKFSLSEDGKATMRGYTEGDVYDLVEFFADRSTAKAKHSAVNTKDVLTGLQARFKKIQNVGGKNI